MNTAVALDLSPLGLDTEEDTGPRRFPASMAKYFVKSVLGRREHVTMLVVAGDAIRSQVEESLWQMNSMACDARPDMFIASCRRGAIVRVVVLLDSQDHASINSAGARAPVMGDFIVVTEDPIIPGSPLARLLAKRRGEHVLLETQL